MPQETLEGRVTALERQVAQLIALTQHQKVKKDWRATFGMFADDPGFDEMLQLGRAIRQQETRKDFEIGDLSGGD